MVKSWRLSSRSTLTDRTSSINWERRFATSAYTVAESTPGSFGAFAKWNSVDGKCAPSLASSTGAVKLSGSRKAEGSSCSNRSEEHTSELQSLRHLVCRLLLE